MSTTIETMNRGIVEDFGFHFDTKRILLGALPAISTEQFIDHSSETIIEILNNPNLDNNLRTKLMITVAFNLGRAMNAFRNRTNTPQTQEDLITSWVLDTMAPRWVNAEGVPVKGYKVNPFAFDGEKVKISNFYEITPEQFVVFSARIIGGGLGGWNRMNVPDNIQQTIEKLIGHLRPRETN